MELVTNRDINKALNDLIEEAEKILVIVSPYIKLKDLGEWEYIVEKLKEKADKGLFLEIHARKE